MSEATAPEQEAFDYRADFPALNQEINRHPITYLDSAASSQPPATVIDAIAGYERHDHANVHRGVHTLSHRATEAYERARDDVVRFINASSRSEIVFTRGTTEAINLVAQSFARPQLKPGDRIVITHLEHHSNIVPWQLLCDQTGAELSVAPIDNTGQVEFESLVKLLEENVRLLAVAYVSNALGTVLPLTRIISEAKKFNIPVLVDAAQAVPHVPLDVLQLDCDFFTFSGHKMYGPTGIGVLYAKEALLEVMPPWQGGGDMILEVSFNGTTWNELPYKFEAGTPNISGAIGLGAAIRYLSAIGMGRIAAHEHEVLRYMMEQLSSVDGIRLIGIADQKTSVQSFLLGDIHPHDLGTILDHQGVAIRTGHHCAMPVMQRFGVPGTARASLGLYNVRDDVDRLIEVLAIAKKVFI
ncbi:MAG: cysteine desulfurase [Pseudomonadota bacterium]|nr:cysteine desulfurase [Pseudomonadota bacterium]